MGEIADAMVNGYFCEQCGCHIDGEEPGYPRLCDDCKKDELIEVIKKIRKSDCGGG